MKRKTRNIIKRHFFYSSNQKFYRNVTNMLSTVIWVVLIFVSFFLFNVYIQYKLRKKGLISHQQEDIYNISSQVQNQEQWPTHNAHLSLDHITLMNQMNKSAYDDAPPSYDEVMKASLQNNGGTSTSELPPPPPPSHAVIVVPPTTTTTSQ
ncbi:uncharacterized protein LOC130895668 isoform X1 [Diorhabda carinulata]|uniref:uncharacterized protein LOC130895668 isoform X1 n=1 Tax=Diorhabda carinulata TaxID=1163345 RepID=UPI0025A1FA8B|nr:uncharacterized protein LOC130895668 isoform X1 [Diorhabda carinulata]